MARVLDQLTLTAWLPASLLTASVALLLQFRAARSANLTNAVRALTTDPVRVLVVMIPLLVIATIVTQAFSFEAIRTLEGYWRRRGPASAARTLMIRRHVRRKQKINERLQKATEDAFYAARPKMLKDGLPIPVVNAIEAHILNSTPPSLTAEEEQELDATRWRASCDAWRLARIDHLINEKESYPVTHRVLPTKLGNLIRATEDRLQHANGDVQGFALRRRGLVSHRVQIQHDQFRNRLDMYCTLVFIGASLSALAPIMLVGRVHIIAVAIITGGYFALSVASYLAAIASAKGYCVILRQMDENSQNLEKIE